MRQVGSAVLKAVCSDSFQESIRLILFLPQGNLVGIIMPCIGEITLLLRTAVSEMWRREVSSSRCSILK